MERSTLDLWVGMFVVAGIAALVMLAMKVGNLSTYNVSETYEVHAYFSNDSVDPWKVYNPNLAPGLSDLLYMIPFKGYWINMTIDATLKVI